MVWRTRSYYQCATENQETLILVSALLVVAASLHFQEYIVSYSSFQRLMKLPSICEGDFIHMEASCTIKAVVQP